MDIQTVFKTGNSFVVSIPKTIVRELGIKLGQKVIVEKTAQADGLVIKTVPKKKAGTKGVHTEFKKWLGKVMKEDAELLRKLAEY